MGRTYVAQNQGDVFGQISPICPSQLDRQETDAFLFPECCSNSYNFVFAGAMGAILPPLRTFSLDAI